jgi:hypothetical protein
MSGKLLQWGADHGKQLPVLQNLAKNSRTNANMFEDKAQRGYAAIPKKSGDTTGESVGQLRKPEGGDAAGNNAASTAEQKVAQPSKVPATLNAKDLQTLPKTPEDAPDCINLKCINGDMQKSWSQSLPNGKAQEHGGTLVADADGNISMINKGAGEEGAFLPDTENIPEGQTLLGTFHTHPYGRENILTKGATTPQSGGDFAWLLDQDNPTEQLGIVQSNSKQFMLLKTQQVTTRDVGYYQSWQDGADALNNLQMSKGVGFSAASRQTTINYAEKYGFAFYEGEDGIFTKVKP